MHQHPVGRRTARALTAVSCAAFLAACGGGDPGPDRADAPPGSRDVPSDGSGPPAGRDRSAAWPGGADDRDVVARRRVGGSKPFDSTSRTPVTVDLLVRGLTVRGRVATLRITAVPRGWHDPGPPEDTSPTLWDLNPGPDADGFYAQLIDPVHLRRHLPLEDSAGESVATMRYAGGTESGQAIEASWIFAAPPPDVRAMDVQLGNWPIFREIPVERR